MPKAILLGFTRALDFSGRTTRSDFFWFAMFAIILVGATWQIDKFFFGHHATQFIITDDDPNDGVQTVARVPYDGTVLLGKVTFLLIVLLAIPLISGARRRLRDGGHGAASLVRLAIFGLAPIILALTPNWATTFEASGLVIIPLFSVAYFAVLSVIALMLIFRLLKPTV